MTVEQQALEDFLLTQPALKAVASQLLVNRTDMSANVLSQLTSKPAPELWALIHTDSAPAGKPGTKAPAAAVKAKGKAGWHTSACSQR